MRSASCIVVTVCVFASPSQLSASCLLLSLHSNSARDPATADFNHHPPHHNDVTKRFSFETPKRAFFELPKARVTEPNAHRRHHSDTRPGARLRRNTVLWIITPSGDEEEPRFRAGGLMLAPLDYPPCCCLSNEEHHLPYSLQLPFLPDTPTASQSCPTRTKIPRDPAEAAAVKDRSPSPFAFATR